MKKHSILNAQYAKECSNQCCFTLSYLEVGKDLLLSRPIFRK